MREEEEQRIKGKRKGRIEETRENKEWNKKKRGKENMRGEGGET